MNFGARRNPLTLSPRVGKRFRHCLAIVRSLLQTFHQSVTPSLGGGTALQTTTMV